MAHFGRGKFTDPMILYDAAVWQLWTVHTMLQNGAAGNGDLQASIDAMTPDEVSRRDVESHSMSLAL